jgi:hypothetical protein
MQEVKSTQGWTLRLRVYKSRDSNTCDSASKIVSCSYSTVNKCIDAFCERGPAVTASKETCLNAASMLLSLQALPKMLRKEKRRL